MSDLKFIFRGVDTAQMANEVKALEERSSTFRDLEARALAKGYTTIDIQMAPSQSDPRGLGGSIASSSQSQTDSGTWNIKISSNYTGTWGIGGRQATVAEIIAHELAHAVVPPDNQDPPGTFYPNEDGPMGTWVRGQTGLVAQDLGLPGPNNVQNLITVVPVDAAQGCTPQNPRGTNGPTDGVTFFFDGSRGWNGIGSVIPPDSGSRDTIKEHRLGTEIETEIAPSGDNPRSSGTNPKPVTFGVDPSAKFSHGKTVVDDGATSPGTTNVIDFSQYGSNVYLAHIDIKDAGSAVGLYKDRNFSAPVGVSFQNFNTLILGGGDNKVQLYARDNPDLKTVQAGDGNDTLTSDVVNLQVHLGHGHNVIGDVAQGTIIYAEGGQNDIVASDDELIKGATPTDQIFSKAGQLLRGGIGYVGQESPWVTGPDGTRYGINHDGDLVIKDKLGGLTYVADYHGGPDFPYDEQTAGIFVGLIKFYAVRLLDLERPFIEEIPTVFKAGNELLYVRTGQTFFNTDPLVFDLSGHGISLTSMDQTSPMLDMCGNGFAVHTGWVGPSNGILVLEQTPHDGTPTITEMLGGPGDAGFAALASHDDNADGVIDANDSVYSQLRMWVDANGDGAVQANELETLAQTGVASISLTTTPPTNGVINGNTVLATGSFTRSDGSTGAIDQVNFNVDTFHSKYLGDTSVSTAASALPNLKGHGTLADLRVAMTIDPALSNPALGPTLIDVVNANLPNLDTPDLNALRNAALPIFVAWARAVQLPDPNGNLQTVDPTASHSDVPMLIETDPHGNVTVDDFAYQVTDASGSYWKLASGHDVKDSQGNIIDRPTFADVMAQHVPSDTPNASWIDFTAAEIGFVERQYGQPFPIDQAPSDPSAMLSAMSSFMTAAFTALNLEAVRLAMQAGPLAQYFPGIAYDAADDKFTATSDAQLTPMYEAIFHAAPSDAAGASQWLAQWKPIIDVVLGDFARGTGQEVTYAYQFTSMVNAFEASSLPIDIKTAAEALGIPQGLIIDGGTSSTISAGDPASIYYLHGGDQTVTSGIGLNNFVMGGTFGHDTIIDDEPGPNAADPSILRFSNVKSTDITATRDGLDLVLDVNGTSEEVRVVNEFAPVRPGLFSGDSGNLLDTWGVAQIAFSDGVVWDMPDIAWAVARPDPTHAVITGTPNMDVLDGGVGGDTYLSGGDGGDIYIFGRGYGHDTIEGKRTDPLNAEANYVKFGAGITKDDLTFTRNGDSNDLSISIDNTADQLTILGEFDAGYSLLGPLWIDRVEGFVFADGSSFSADDLMDMLDRQAMGQPVIYGFDHEDTLDGGSGVHFISGGNENDTYIFDPGASYDIVKDLTTNILSGMNDTIAIGADSPQDVTFSLQGTAGDLLITLADGSTMLVRDQFGIDIGDVSFNRIENFTFGDGTTLTWDQVRAQIIGAAETAGSDAVIGTDYADTLDGGAGNDYLSGGNGADTYVFGHGYGHDTIDVNATELLNSGNASVHFKADVSASDVTWSRLDQDLVIKLNGTNDSLTVLGQFAGQYSGAGVASFVFADGTTLSAGDVSGMVSNTVISGTSGDDVLRSTSGDAVLAGGNGNDTYTYLRGDGFERIEVNKTAGAGYVDTLAFTDIASTEVMLLRWGGRGVNDLVISIDGTNGAPQGQVTIANQFGYGESSADAPINQITFSDGVTWTEADIEAKLIVQEEAQTGANITVTGFGGADTLTAGSNARTLTGGSGGDTYVWSAGDGATFIADHGRMDNWSSNEIDRLVIHGLAPTDVTVTRSPEPGSNDLVLTAPGQGPIILQNQTSHQSHDSIEQVRFDDGTVWDYSDLLLLADGGIASTPNGTTARSFAGANANSTLAGTASDDVYFWGAGNGNDTITEGDFDPWQKADAVRLVGLNPGDVTFNIVENGSRDLRITNKVTGETLTVQGQFYGASNDGSNTWAGAGTGIERVIFADGTVWNPQQILTHSAYLAAPGATAVNNLDLGDGTIAIQASPGVTDLNGLGNSADTYIWSPGDGSDTITDTNGSNNSLDTLRLVGVAKADVRLARAGHDLVVTDLATGESITVKYEFPFATVGNGIERISFDDGTVWDRTYINTHQQIYGTSGDDVLNGTGDDETFDGLGGNDTYNDHSWTTDTFIYASSYGNDTVDYQTGDAAKTATLKLTDINPDGITLTKIDTQLYITVTSTGKVIHDVDHFFATTRGITQIQFGDGTVWNRATIDANAHTPLTGGPGDYLLDRGTGHVTVFAGTVTGTIRVPDGFGPNDIVFQADNSGNLTVALRGTSDSVTLIGDLSQHGWGVASSVGTITFTDGSTMGLGQPWWGQGTPFTFTWTGTSTNTTLTGSNYGTNLFNLGAGGDTITGGNNSLGGSGSNIFAFDKGDGHAHVNLNGGTGTVRMASDIDPSDVIYQGSNNGDLTVLLKDTGDSITFSNDLSQHSWGVLSQVGEIDFANGTTWSVGQPWYGQGTPFTFTWIGTASNTTLTGSNYGANVFDLGPGGDTVTGGNTSLGGSGVNTVVFDKGDGAATVDLNNGTGVIQMASDIDPSDVILQSDSAGDLIVKLRDASDSITFSNDLSVHSWGVASLMQQINFANGTSWTIGQPWWGQGQPITFTWLGTSGNDTLTGSAFGNNVFDGGAGNDTLNGGNANDTYLYGVGSGNDTIIENGDGNATDQVKLSGLNPADVTLSRSGNDLYITINSSGERLKVQNHFSGTAQGIEQLAFANGTTWDRTTIQANVPITGTTGNDNLGGTSGNDQFFGDLGDDRLSGGAGSDTYIYRSGDGNDIIDDESGSTSDVDVLKFTDLNPSDIKLTRNGNDLWVDMPSTGQRITVAWHFFSQSQNWGVERFDFANGTSWDLATINANAWLRGTSGNDNIGGTSWNDTFFGGTGDDRMSGGAGSDTYIYRSGDGNDVIDDESGSTSEVDVLKFTDLNPSDIMLTRNGNDLWVDIPSTGQRIDVAWHFFSQSQNWGVERFDFANGTSWDLATINANAWLRGTSGNDTINGTSWNDTFYGGAGNDTLNGNGGYDTYRFGATFGQNVINNYGSDGSGSPKGEIDFASGLDHTQLWFARSGNDLQIDLLGTNDQVKVTNWYASDSRNQVQSITAGDGSKIDSQIAQLVTAMATYSANNPGFDPTTASQMPNDSTLQTTIASSWH